MITLTHIPWGPESRKMFNLTWNFQSRLKTSISWGGTSAERRVHEIIFSRYTYEICHEKCYEISPTFSSLHFVGPKHPAKFPTKFPQKMQKKLRRIHRRASAPKGPKIEKIQSRLKISISLENFNLDWTFQSWPSEFPTKNRGLLGVEIEMFNLDWKFQSRRAILNFFNLWALRGRRAARTTSRLKCSISTLRILPFGPFPKKQRGLVCVCGSLDIFNPGERSWSFLNLWAFRI